MNCFFHENKPAVIQCEKCGVGLCRECMDKAIYTYNGKVVCMNCSKPMAEEELNDARKARLWSLVKFIFSGLFLGIGLMTYAGGADIMNVWIIAGVAGIPTAFKGSRRSREQRLMDDFNDSRKSDMIDLMFGWAFRLLFKLVFIIALAPICAVFTFFSNLIKFAKSGKQIKEAEDTLAYIEQCLNEEQEPIIEPPMQEEPALLPPTAMQAEVPLQPQSSAATCTPAQAQPQAETVTAPALQPAPVSQPAQSQPSFQNRQSAPTPPPLAQTKKSNGMAIGIAVAAVIVIGLIATYFTWYVSYAKDRDALRTYVVATNVFLRSSQVAGVEYNVLNKLPYGSELITYSISGEWAEVKANGTTGYVASAYLLNQADFNLLHGVWGNMDARDCIISSKCRLAILDYYKSHALSSGSTGWQIYTKQKDQKPNTVSYPRLCNKGSKFTDFIFIAKNNATGERTLACYSFEDETERPIFRFDTTAPADGYIRSVQGSYTGARIVFDTGAELNVEF